MLSKCELSVRKGWGKSQLHTRKHTTDNTVRLRADKSRIRSVYSDRVPLSIIVWLAAAVSYGPHLQGKIVLLP